MNLVAVATENVNVPRTSYSPQHGWDQRSGWELHEFGAVMLELPEPLSKRIADLAAAIPDEYLVKREAHPHVTVKYGLTTLNDAEIRVLVEGSGPIQLTLGPYAIFRNPGEDVLTVLVASEQLYALRNTLEHGSGWDDGHPWQEDYLAHITIAYFVPGFADAYDSEVSPFLGEIVTIDQAVWSPKEGGGPAEVMWLAEKGGQSRDKIGQFATGGECPLEGCGEPAGHKGEHGADPMPVGHTDSEEPIFKSKYDQVQTAGDVKAWLHKGTAYWVKAAADNQGATHDDFGGEVPIKGKSSDYQWSGAVRFTGSQNTFYFQYADGNGDAKAEIRDFLRANWAGQAVVGEAVTKTRPGTAVIDRSWGAEDMRGLNKHLGEATLAEVIARQHQLAASTTYEQESAVIRANAAKPENQRQHRFQAAEWTYKNGHPRCLRCGGEESVDGTCTPAP